MQLERLGKPGKTGTAVWLGLALALMLGMWATFGSASPAQADTSPEGCSANNLSLDIQRQLGPGQSGPANASVVSQGQEILYEVTAENINGDGCDVIDATVTLTLPAADGTATGTVVNLTPGSTIYDGTDADFPADGSGDTTYAPVSYTVNVNPGVTSIVAQADVSSPNGLLDTPEGQPGDLVEITKTVSSTIAEPEIAVEKTPDGEVIEAGDTASFTIAVTATGLGVASDVMLDDELPAGYTWTESPDNADCTITGGTTLNCDIGDMTDGDVFTVTVETATVNPDDCNVTLDNLATVSGSNFESVQDAGDISIICPELTIEKTPDGGSAVAPGTASFTIVVTNVGSGTATGVTIDDTLPTLPSGGSWVENPDLAECDITGGNVLGCDVGDLGEGGSFEVTAEIPISDPEDCDVVLDNTAFANAENHGEVSDVGDIEILCEAPQLQITKSPDGGTIEPGSTAKFSITVTNLGPGTAFDTVLNDELPAGYVWSEDPDNADCEITGDTTLNCDIGDMAPDDTFTVTVSTETDPEQAECLLENVAFASASNHDEVSDPGDIVCTSRKVSSVTTFLGGDSASGGTPWGAAATGIGLAGLIAGSTYVLRRRTRQEVAAN